MRRQRYTVAFERASGQWVTTTERREVGRHATQAAAVTDATALCTTSWKHLQLTSELVIKARNGRIRDTRTYGRDPRRTRG